VFQAIQYEFQPHKHEGFFLGMDAMLLLNLRRETEVCTIGVLGLRVASE
jgi:hypothetical protein